MSPLVVALPCEGVEITLMLVALPLIVGEITLLLLFIATVALAFEIVGAGAWTVMLMVAVPEVPPGPVA